MYPPRTRERYAPSKAQLKKIKAHKFGRLACFIAAALVLDVVAIASFSPVEGVASNLFYLLLFVVSAAFVAGISIRTINECLPLSGKDCDYVHELSLESPSVKNYVAHVVNNERELAGFELLVLRALANSDEENASKAQLYVRR
jgi:hypothetical protein